MKRVYKYGTGHPVPKGAVYLTTLTEEIRATIGTTTKWVWHYFLVEEK